MFKEGLVNWEWPHATTVTTRNTQARTYARTLWNWYSGLTRIFFFPPLKIINSFRVHYLRLRINLIITRTNLPRDDRARSAGRLIDWLIDWRWWGGGNECAHVSSLCAFVCASGTDNAPTSTSSSPMLPISLACGAAAGLEPAVRAHYPSCGAL